MAMRILSFLLLFLLLLSLSAAATATSSSSLSMGFFSSAAGGEPECRGTVAECIGDAEEFDLGSESARRILAARRYISYGALRRDTVPCSRRGASYYNCRPGAWANPYSRGCSRITRCRS